MEPSLQNLNKAAITNGLILAAITFVINVVIYYVAPSLMGSTMFGVGIGVISLVLYIVFTIDLRKKIGGFWTFRQALKGIFLMAFIAGLTSGILQTLFYKFVEPQAFDKIWSFVETNLTNTYDKMGMDQDKIDEVIVKVKENMQAQFNPTIAQFFKTLAIGILIEFIMSLIFAAIFKKEQPVFASVQEEE
ncbi:DUF4199 family protein [Pedobacter sp. HMF7647]|uniref:DUF4199 family protein n=1 Tax=Hufsiella arboris TaxID=2695275 RepID=A0A7K1YFC6_9SPHI|nr:DUF4199 domain-containing protein [Hufsiella arboris]MXV53272.1 DUF4199 family protein [Hufsiella arboris]